MLKKTDRIDRTVPIPLYYQLKELVLSEIRDGNYKSGDPIPTENEISEAFHLSRTTVRQAITELVQEGWLYRVKSKGTFVARPKISQNYIRKLESFNDQMYRLGITPSTEVLELSTVKGSEVKEQVRKALQLTEKDSIIYLYRRRSADGEPIVTLKTFLPYEECKDVLEHDLTEEKLYSVLFQKEETTIFRIERMVEAIEATSEDARLLGIEKGKPIQFFVSVGYNPYDKPIEYTISRYRGDRNKFEVTVFPERT